MTWMPRQPRAWAGNVASLLNATGPTWSSKFTTRHKLPVFTSCSDRGFCIEGRGVQKRRLKNEMVTFAPFTHAAIRKTLTSAQQTPQIKIPFLLAPVLISSYRRIHILLKKSSQVQLCSRTPPKSAYVQNISVCFFPWDCASDPLLSLAFYSGFILATTWFQVIRTVRNQGNREGVRGLDVFSGNNSGQDHFPEQHLRTKVFTTQQNIPNNPITVIRAVTFHLWVKQTWMSPLLGSSSS